MRQAIAYVWFGLFYYLLAAYAASLPIQSGLPLFIWPAHGVALGVLLVAPKRRWPVYLGLVLLGTLAVGVQMGYEWKRIGATMLVNIAQPVFVAGRVARPARPAGARGHGA